ncbi:MAG TPA: flagellar hook-associated protein FlgK [Nocardioidaceae bacterium]|nr:flagellar hook-associated protein FlgK [Nocardioidaceae bacterium]
MSGTMSSFSTALSALRYNKIAMDVASGNVANAGTAGYARRQVIAQATGAPATPAIWSRWTGAGDGVQASRIERMVDPLLDARSRTEHAASSYLDTRSASLVRFETTLDEPGDGGIAAALSAFQQGWHDVANNPGDEAARSQLLARAESLRSAIATQGRSVATEWSMQRSNLDALGEQVNQATAELAELNQGLKAADLAGTDAGTLLDQRDQLTLKLAELTGAGVTVNDDTTVTVSIAGQTVVDGTTATTLDVSGATTMADAATDPVTVSIGGAAVTLGSGEVGAAQQLLTGDLPDYLSKLNGFVATLVDQANTQHAAGVDLDGATGTPLFTGTTADTLQVAISDPRKIAAADPSVGGLDNGNAEALAGLDLGAEQYRQLVTSFGVTVSSAQQAASNQGTLTAQVDASRESLSGINVDEEMVHLLAAQRGYEGAARVLTAVDSMLDTLINHTGLVG